TSGARSSTCRTAPASRSSARPTAIPTSIRRRTDDYPQPYVQDRRLSPAAMAISSPIVPRSAHIASPPSSAPCRITELYESAISPLGNPECRSVLGRLALQRGVDHPGKRFELERLLQRRAIAIFLRQARRAVAGGEDKGTVARLDQFGDRRNHLAVDVDVEDRDVEFGRLRELHGFVDLTSLGRDTEAQFLEHVGDHHPDHHLVFNEEHRAAWRPRGCHGVVLALPKPTFAKNADLRNVNVGL